MRRSGTEAHQRRERIIGLAGRHMSPDPAASCRSWAIFSIASLFLPVRFHTLDEQADWLRRRIGDPTAISALYLRGGTIFIIAAITGSPGADHCGAVGATGGLGGLDVGSQVVEWGQFLQRYLPVSSSGKGLWADLRRHIDHPVGLGDQRAGAGPRGVPRR